MRVSAARVATVAAAVLVGAVAVGCAAPVREGGGEPPAATATERASAYDAHDVAFLQRMLAHQQQAVQLTAMVPERTASAQLVALAQQLLTAQRAGIDGFRAQLMQWDKPLVAPESATVDGAVDQVTVEKLTTLHGTGFDTLWLQSMIAHHRGAITMAHAEIAEGSSPDVISIARSVAASQQAEIDQMNQLLGG